MTIDEVASLGVRFEEASATAILTEAARLFPGGRLTFATGFGVEGCVVVDLIARAGLPVDVFTLDTGLLFPETYALWRRLETRYGLVIRGVEPALTLAEQEATLGAKLWERAPDDCCGVRKVEPLRKTLASFDAWVTAIRRDQTSARAGAMPFEWDSKFGLVKVNPLVRWTSKDVWRHVFTNDVPYNPLHDDGFPSIGCAPCTSRVGEGEDARSGRWRGKGKTECGLHAK